MSSTLTLSCLTWSGDLRDLPSFPTRRSSDLRQLVTALHVHNPRDLGQHSTIWQLSVRGSAQRDELAVAADNGQRGAHRSEEHTSELQSPCNLVCRLLLEKKKKH